MRYENLRLRLSIDRSLSAQCACSAALLAVQDKTFRGAVMPRFHQFGFDKILDEFNFQDLPAHGGRNRGLDHTVRYAYYVALRCFGQSLIAMKTRFGAE